MKLLTLKDVRRVAKKHGAELAEQHSGPSGRYFHVIVDLLDGLTWAANGCQGIYAQDYTNDLAGRHAACSHAIEQMERGVNEAD